MSESYDKLDFIIIIVLSLLVAFIIGFNIIQVIDTKLSSVTINVPPQENNLPPIYLNIDKDSNIKQIKLNDVISTQDNQVDMEIENFGNLKDYPDNYQEPKNRLIANLISSKTGDEIINQKTYYEDAKNKNFNTLNNIPLLIAPDTDNATRAPDDAIGYYNNKVKLVTNSDSPLLKIAKENLKNINNIVSKCSIENSNNIPEINGTFDGYNSFVNLKEDSFANVTSIGKGMLTPYNSFPVPS